MKLPQFGFHSAFPRVCLLAVLVAVPRWIELAAAQQRAQTSKDSSTWSLIANPVGVNFGHVAVGSSLTLPVALTNAGSSQITIVQDHESGSSFSWSGLNLPLTLAAGESFTFNITFSPQSVGPAGGSLWLSSPRNPSLRIPFKGVGTVGGQLTISPTSMNFGNVVDETSASQTGTLAASGSSVTITSASNSNSEFVLSGVALPLTLAAGQSASFTVTFTPQSSGVASSTLAFSANSTSAATAPLTGTGIPPYTVSLSWNPSSSPVVGYNVYRGGKTGGPYSMISSLDSNTFYTDNTVAAGQTYYYVTTAVNSSGQESAYSNQVKAVIP